MEMFWNVLDIITFVIIFGIAAMMIGEYVAMKIAKLQAKRKVWEQLKKTGLTEEAINNVVKSLRIQ